MHLHAAGTPGRAGFRPITATFIWNPPTGLPHLRRFFRVPPPWPRFDEREVVWLPHAYPMLIAPVGSGPSIRSAFRVQAVSPWLPAFRYHQDGVSALMGASGGNSDQQSGRQIGRRAPQPHPAGHAPLAGSQTRGTTVNKLGRINLLVATVWSSAFKLRGARTA